MRSVLKMTEKIKRANEMVPPDEGFVTYFHEFLGENRLKIIDLHTDAGEIADEFWSTMFMFGEPKKKSDLGTSGEYLNNYADLFKGINVSFQAWKAAKLAAEKKNTSFSGGKGSTPGKSKC
jgi:hypothetical protein